MVGSIRAARPRARSPLDPSRSTGPMSEESPIPGRSGCEQPARLDRGEAATRTTQDTKSDPACNQRRCPCREVRMVERFRDRMIRMIGRREPQQRCDVSLLDEDGFDKGTPDRCRRIGLLGPSLVFSVCLHRSAVSRWMEAPARPDAAPARPGRPRPTSESAPRAGPAPTVGVASTPTFVPEGRRPGRAVGGWER